MSKEDESQQLPQSVKVDRVRQLRNGLHMRDKLSELIENHGGWYNVEIGYDDATDTMQTEHIDRTVIKGIEGGLEGVYHELVESGEKIAAEAVVFDYKKETGQT